MQTSKVQFKETEKDFSRLLDRYNKSKMVIDQLCSQKENKENKDNSKIDIKPDTPNTKEVVSRDKYQKVRSLNKELKVTLKEYIDRTKDLEDDNQQKEQVIQRYEKELNQSQELLQKQMHENRENAYKDETHNSMIENMKQQISLLKAKTIKKKSKIQMLKETIKCLENKQDDQSQGFKSELERVQKLCEEFSVEIKDQEKKNYILQDENDVLKQAINQRDEQLRYFELTYQDDKQLTNKLNARINDLQDEKKLFAQNLETQLKKVSELDEQLKQADLKSKEAIHRLEQDKKQQLLDFETALGGKRAKNKNLKSKLSEQDQMIQQLQKDDIGQQKYIQELQSDLAKQSQLLNRYKQVEDDYAQRQYTIKELQEQIKDYDIQYQIDQKSKSNYVQELNYANDEIQRLTHIVYDSDKEVQYLRQQQEYEIAMIEKKVDQLVNELSVSREETQEFKNRVNDLKKQITTIEDQSNQNKGKYLKAKQNVKSLEQEVKYLEEKMRLLENERILEQREAIKTKDLIVQQQQKQQSKVKVLDEIQNMIKQHKGRD